MNPRWSHRLARFAVALTLALVAGWGALVAWALGAAGG